jgi:hypothetical protein
MLPLTAAAYEEPLLGDCMIALDSFFEAIAETTR